ncbi:hypothetical protein HOD30_04290 [Candidatus Peregrinibacteria bacterium]|jgi:hypothetical protein|nr:hypothetical protein [Candidatus Peregrinibacteria bacterium]MBT4632178.1 hypothetical protein [Candidatus Peregrinibacteria bacterium]MBT5516739.1 hypothetical protein [Candidatus Peregrinibacteria bacterium]MBT5824096.1 hypothetical protein [Candidatus Peregrinibacteria bacterium]
MNTRNDIIAGLCFVIPLAEIRSTPSVQFHNIPGIVEGLSAVDRVEHQAGAQSPSIAEDDCARPWYMHPNQEDNLIVFEGKRVVDLYNIAHAKVETFEVYKNKLLHNGEIIHEGAHIFGWPTDVFHRVQSPDGSLSMNFARHFDGFDIKSNFNIYDLDEASGEYRVLRAGHLDQPKVEIGE